MYDSISRQSRELKDKLKAYGERKGLVWDRTKKHGKKLDAEWLILSEERLLEVRCNGF